MVVSYKFCQNMLENCENGKSQCVNQEVSKIKLLHFRSNILGEILHFC